MKRYVALGSSMAAGPGIAPRAAGSPWPAMRSARNYAHLTAARLGLDLVDVTYSGATCANILTDHQHRTPPQLEALDGSEELVTITIGGNDVGYVPLLTLAALPAPLRRIAPANDLFDPAARDAALATVRDALVRVGAAVRDRAPHARVVFVDYLTLLPPSGTPPPIPADLFALGHRVAAGLEAATADAAAATGCEVVRAGAASRDHHPWSREPWTTKPSWLIIPVPGRGPAPLHPNAAGMRAVADLVVAAL
ncbi:SGNH/GDSL hydrolase family protein [Mycolicibacterium cosmeticum]|uniref:SGNH/GDSL hydrolase family protein n=1 Tax=Mycolicibacterium cosmeticum TaxID=258533 RepID=UPI0032049C4B